MARNGIGEALICSIGGFAKVSIILLCTHCSYWWNMWCTCVIIQIYVSVLPLSQLFYHSFSFTLWLCSHNLYCNRDQNGIFCSATSLLLTMETYSFICISPNNKSVHLLTTCLKYLNIHLSEECLLLSCRGAVITDFVWIFFWWKQ